MNKHFFPLLLAMGPFLLWGQNNFQFIKTTYVGALPADSTEDWTRHWTNWNPQTTPYSDPTDSVTLNAMASDLPVIGEKDILNVLTLDPGKVYLLQGLVVVRAGGKLVIPAGTLIRARSRLDTVPKNYASILVERGGQLEVLGTAGAPVVITSAKAPGERKGGDWGGVILAGRSYHNQLDGGNNNNVQVEGFETVAFDPALARIGGALEEDNSGVLQYLRIEFPGLSIDSPRQINGLTLGAVGSGTEINHIQVSYGFGDGFEWFGGTVNSSHLIAYKNADDDFDMSFGYSGCSQFGIGLKDTAYYNPSYPSGLGDVVAEGFESDNESIGNFPVKPYTNAIFSNYTMLGAVPVGSTYDNLNTTSKTVFRRGARIRRNSSLRIVNSIFMGYRNFLMLGNDSCLRATNYPPLLALVSPSTPVDVFSKQIFFTNNLIVNTHAAYNHLNDTIANGLVEVSPFPGSLAKLNALDAWIRQPGPLANNIDPVPYTTGSVLVNPLAMSTMPDFRPVPGSPALQGANFADNPLLADPHVSQHDVGGQPDIPVYPNPNSTGHVYFGHMVETYRVFDLRGRLVASGFHADQANLESVTSGMYFIQIGGGVQKLVLSRQ